MSCGLMGFLSQTVRSGLRYSRFALSLAAIGLFVMSMLWPVAQPVRAATGINKTLNFQGRLLNAAGAVVADGTYNMEFKIYQGGDGVLGGGDETLKWTEDWVYGSGSPDHRVTVRNGYFSLALGSITAFGTSVDWNQDTLWLSTNVGNTSQVATFAGASGDGEMTPFRRLSSAVYALNAGQLGGLAASDFAQLAVNQTFSGANTFQPAANVTGVTIKQNSQGSPTADIFGVQTQNSTAVIQATGPAVNEAALLLQSVGATRDLTLSSGSGTIMLGSSVTKIQRNAAALSIDLNTAVTSTLTVTNSDVSNVANLSVEGGVTAGTSLTIGQSTTLTGTIVFNNSANINTITLTSAAAGSNQVITLPNATGTVCLTSGNCAGVGGTGDILQGGNSFGAAVTLGTNDNFGLNLEVNNIAVATFSNTGAVNFSNSTNSTQALNIKNSSAGNVFTVDTTNSRVGINLGGANTPTLKSGTAGLELQGALRFSGTGGVIDDFAAATGNVGARINVPFFAYSAFDQAIAIGVSAVSDDRARGISVFDARLVAHQPSIGVHSPDEASMIGFTWNGLNTIATVQTTNNTSSTRGIILQSGNVSSAGSSGDVQVNTGTISGSIGYTTGNIYVVTGSGAGTDSSTGNIIIDPGSKTGAGTAGTVTIGGINASSVSIGRTGAPLTLQGSTVSVGTIGTATGQLYVSGKVPTAAAGSVATGMAPYSVAVEGSYAYAVNNTSNTLQVFNISNPASPVSVGSVVTGSGPRNVAVAGRYAYVVNNTANTLQIFDISNPASPVSVGSVSTGSGPREVAVSGRYAYVVNATANTLQVFDVSNPASPVSVGSLATDITPSGVAIAGRYAYVVHDSGSASLWTIDVSNPASPTMADNLFTVGGLTPYRVTVSGKYAYITSSNGYLYIANISDPANAVYVSLTSLGFVANDIVVAGRYAYVAVDNTLAVVDISNPASPSNIGTVATGAGPRELAVAGRYAYIVNSSANTLQTFDIGGTYTQSLEAGAIKVTSLSADNDISVGGNISSAGGLNIGGASLLNGSLAVNGPATFKNAANSTTAFLVQNASGHEVLGVDTAGSQVLLGKSSNVTGKLLVYNSTNGNTITIQSGTTTASYTLTLPTAAAATGECLKAGTVSGSSVPLTWGSCGGGGGGSTRQIYLVPEYPGAILTADGSNNTGTVTSDFDSVNVHNYYSWVSSQGTLNDYDIVARTAIPSEYVSGFGTFKIWAYGTSNSTANNDILVTIKDASGTACANAVSVLPGTATIWTQQTVALSGCTFAANNLITITIRMASQSNNAVRVGEISYQYTN